MTRRFVRRTSSAGWSVETVAEWCDLARRAPSAGFAQGTHFMIRQHVAPTLGALGAREWFAERQPGVLDASFAVVVLADRSAYVERYGESDKAGHGLETADGWRIPYWLTDAGMAIQNLLLVAESHGQGALFIGVFRDPRPALASWGVPESVDCVGVVLLGERADDDRPSGSPTRRPRRPKDSVVHLESW